jgi:ferrous iron transport protein A
MPTSPLDKPLCLLADLPSGGQALVRALLSGTEAQDAQTLLRLGELGFIAGEPVRMLRRGPGGREPLAVQIGDTQFALRLLEARCVQVQPL